MNVSVFHHSTRGTPIDLITTCPGDKFELVSISPSKSWITFSIETGLIATATVDARPYVGTYTVTIRHTKGYNGAVRTVAYTIAVTPRVACNAIAWNAISQGDHSMAVGGAYQKADISLTLVNDAAGTTWSTGCGFGAPTVSTVSSPSWATIGTKVCTWARHNLRRSANAACGNSTVYSTLV